VQQGLANWQDDPWSEMARGLDKEEDQQLNSDEHHLRTFWRRWNEMMGGK
jgi:p-cumate 2,3-dioxygenase alpha subunit